MRVKQWLKGACDRVRQGRKQSLSLVRSRLHPFNTRSPNPGVAAYWTIAAIMTLWWLIGSIHLWSLVLHYHGDVPIAPTVSSGTVVTVSVGLSAIPLALLIMLGQMFSGHAGRLRVILYESKAQLSLVAAVATCVVCAVIGGRFHAVWVLTGLGAIAALSCYSIVRALVLLQRPDEYAGVRGRFIMLRQSTISAGSSHRQQNAGEATEEFAKWGNGIRVDPWFEYFHKDRLDKYVGIPAQQKGLVDTVDVQVLHRVLTTLQKYAPSSATGVASPETAQTVPASGGTECDPLIVICHLPGEMIQDKEETLALLRKDILPSTELCGTLVKLTARAFMLDPSEGVTRATADLQSEARELGYELMQGIRGNDPGAVAEFQQVSKRIVEDVSKLEERGPSNIARETYFDLLMAVARATDEARCTRGQVDREIRDLILGFPRVLASFAVETGDPEVLQRCLWPWSFQCRDALQEHPGASETRGYLSSYGALLQRIQSLADPNARDKIDGGRAVLEAKLLLQSLSSLLLECARHNNWDAMTAVADEIPVIDSRLSLQSAEYLGQFEELVQLLHFGAYSCLIDLAMTKSPTEVHGGFLVDEWLRPPMDFVALLHIYASAIAEGSVSGSNWGWEPPQPPRKAYFIRTDEVLACGFVAAALSLPDSSLFQESGSWIAGQTRRLEEAVKGPEKLAQLLGERGSIDSIVRDDSKIAKLVTATGQNQNVADQAVAALRKLLDHLQEKAKTEELARIRSAQVPEITIQSYQNALVEQYDAGDQPRTVIMEKMGLLSTNQQPPGTAEEHGSFGFNKLEAKQWFIGQESETWTQVGKEYVDGLHRGEQKTIIEWLARISLPIELSSLFTCEGHLEESKGMLFVNSSLYLLPPDLKAAVKISEPANADCGDPDAFFEVCTRQIPMYQFSIQDMAPCFLFISSSNSACAVRVPWDAEEGWKFSAKREVKARLRVLSQDTDARDRFLKDDPLWLQEEGKTREAKIDFLETQVWIQVYEQLLLEPGPHPSILRLDLPRDPTLE